MTRDEIIEAVNISWGAWTEALDGIPAELTSEPGVCGYFSIKDLIGHIAFWDTQDLSRAHELAAGESVEPNDWQSMNDADYAAHKDDTLEAQTARMIDAHARLSADLLTLEPIDETIIQENVWGHYDEHREEVLSWRASKGI